MHLASASCVSFGFWPADLFVLHPCFLVTFSTDFEGFVNNACCLAWLLSSVVVMLWVSSLFFCCAFVPFRLSVYVFFSLSGLENTVFLDVLAFLVELRGWFAWCSWGPFLLLPFALGLSLVRLWLCFGLQALSRQLYQQELIGELSALCWGSSLFTSYSSSWPSVAWIFCHVS